MQSRPFHVQCDAHIWVSPLNPACPHLTWGLLPRVLPPSPWPSACCMAACDQHEMTMHANVCQCKLHAHGPRA